MSAYGQRRSARVLFQRLRVFVDLAADDRAQPGHDVAAESPAADDHAEDLTQRGRHAVSGDILGRGDDHALSSVTRRPACPGPSAPVRRPR